MSKYNYEISKEELDNIVKESEFYSEVLRKLNWRVHTNFYKRLKLMIEKYNIDCSHFKEYNDKMHDKQDLKEILIKNSKYTSSRHLKFRLINENILKYECSICGLSLWLNKPISLHLDHINGINDDNRLENLRLLCPNCHSQTDTYCGKNSNHINTRNNFYCIDCGKSISKRAKRCSNCINKYRTKLINKPTKEELQKEVEEKGYIKTGRKYGVCGNTIKKWINMK